MVKDFHSPLAAHIAAFLDEKHACGYRFVAETATLRRFDRFLCQHDSGERLTRELVELWTAKQPHERPRTHKARLLVIRQFGLYLRRHGREAYVPDSKLTPMTRLEFVPYIFTQEQVRRLLESVDRLPVDPRSPERHLVMPELFRVLYGCGLRTAKHCDCASPNVDFEHGVLTIRQSKFRKDRLVPLSPPPTARLRRYACAMNLHNMDSVFFPNPLGGSYSLKSIYHLFRRLLRQCGIPHGGRGYGPRLHDLRHTFAVHCLERWYRQGEDLNAQLPLLVAYLGHESLRGTQRYLRLTPAVFPDIVARLEAFLHPTHQS